MKIIEIAAKMSGFHCQFCKGSLMKVHYPKLYNMAHLLALNVLLLPKDLTIIFILKTGYSSVATTLGLPSRKHQNWFDENGDKIQRLLEEKHRLHKAHQSQGNARFLAEKEN